jgi:hypothetical protein
LARRGGDKDGYVVVVIKIVESWWGSKLARRGGDKNGHVVVVALIVYLFYYCAAEGAATVAVVRFVLLGVVAAGVGVIITHLPISLISS